LEESPTDDDDDDRAVWYVLTASSDAVLPQIQPFQPSIDLMQSASREVLEVAATYTVFRVQGDEHLYALERVRRKKPSKCKGNNIDLALALLDNLRLPTSSGETSSQRAS
jgi:hypothetical protein